MSTLPPSEGNVHVAAAAGVGGRLTLALMQERVDVAGVVAALGPWMARWRAQHFDTSVDLLEVGQVAPGVGFGGGVSAEEVYEMVGFALV